MVRLATENDAADVARLGFRDWWHRDEPANPASLRLYESLGFEAWSNPPGERNLLMRRRL